MIKPENDSRVQQAWWLSSIPGELYFEYYESIVSLCVGMDCWVETVVVKNLWKRPLGCSRAMIQMKIGGCMNPKWYQRVFADFELAVCFIIGDDPLECLLLLSFLHWKMFCGDAPVRDPNWTLTISSSLQIDDWGIGIFVIVPKKSSIC